MLACRLILVKKYHCRDDLHRMSVKCMTLLHSYMRSPASDSHLY